MAKFWFDSEFMEDGKTIELLSIGIVSDDGREFYAESEEADWSQANDWVKENVLPHMKGGKACHSRAEIRDSIVELVATSIGRPEFWGYYADYDWVVMCQLFGRMIDLPRRWPMYCMDIKQYAVSIGDPPLPPQESTEHNALNDAQWNRVAWNFLRAIETTTGRWP